MSVVNHTPFPAICFRQLTKSGQMNGVVSVRGTFVLLQNRPLQQADTQMPLVLSDQYEADPHLTAQVAQSDLIPYKPGTDVSFQGSTYAPEGKPSPTWVCGLRVGPMEKRLRVHGIRFWKPLEQNGKETEWRLTDALPATEVPLHWSRAWGGSVPDEEGHLVDVHRFNPLGCGLVYVTEDQTPVPAPQLEDPQDPITDWKKDYMPQSTGLVSPWWRQRQQYAGTYDDAWKENRHPLLPEDFDYRFYQGAPPDMVVRPWLSGDEEIQLVHLHPDIQRIRSCLPSLDLRVRLLGQTGPMYADLILDGVHFDLRAGVNRVFLTWRAGFPWADGQGVPELAMRRKPEAAFSSPGVRG